MRKTKKKSLKVKSVNKHPLLSHHDTAVEVFRDEIFDTYNKVLEIVAYNYGGELVYTINNIYENVGLPIARFDEKNKSQTYGDTIDRLSFILPHFSSKNKKTKLNCKKLLKLYRKYKWPMRYVDKEFQDSEMSDIDYVPILPLTWHDLLEKNYNYMKELCELVVKCVDETNIID